MKDDKVIIFDTTLRDGEQSPGASMDITQKLEIAYCLAEMGVDIIESGFPVSSHKQFEASQLIAKEVRSCTIAGLARALHKDIDMAADAIKDAENPRIHTFIATSPIHRKYKLQKSKEDVIRMTKEAVLYARNKCAEVEFSAEDATRTELDFLVAVVETAISAGASTINIPDTVGYTTPDEIFKIFTYLKNNVSNIDKCILSAHNHNDLGLAVANTLSAIKGGARQVEVTINGIGERAGNAALEEVVMALDVRYDTWQIKSRINTEKIYPTSKLLSNTIGFPIPRNKAVVGDNAFAHEAGIHQDGVLKHSATYEILTPEKIGRKRNSIVLGRHSGLAGLTGKLKELNIHVDETKIPEIYEKFSELADKKKEIYDEDLYALISTITQERKKFIELIKLEVFITPNTTPKAKIEISNQKQEIVTMESQAEGPIDAIFTSIANSCDFKIKLIQYHVNAVTPGKEAVGEAAVVLLIEDNEYTGRGASVNILEASADAYIAAINNYLITKGNLSL